MGLESKPFVRPIDPQRDAEATFIICQKTVGADIRTGLPNLVAPYIWNVPYVRLEPDYCFVVDNGNGDTVGYIHCAPNTPSFIRKYREEYIPILESLDSNLKQPVMDPPADWSKDIALGVLQLLHKPEEMMHSVSDRFVKEYPAHLHIDILPEYQRMGFGRQLMENLWAKLRGEGVPGVHLVMDGKNVDAEKFYMAIGFQRFDEVVDGGKSGQMGKEDNGNLWLVKNLL